MHVGLAIFLALLFTQVLALQLQELLTCDRDEVTLECPEGWFVAIHGAQFTNNGSKGLPSCSSDLYEDETLNTTCSEDLRIPVNYRCSGMNNCTFELDQHFAARQCTEPGTIIIMYACVPESKAHKFCNRPVEETEGYLKSPSYPLYYPGPVTCEWTLRAGEGQHLLVSLLDLSMADTATNDDADCPDRFTLLDGQVKLLDTCGERLHALRLYESESNLVTIRMKSHMFGAKRGMLLWYKTTGCPTMPAPEHGYLVYRNATFAQYMCCNKHFFEDTLDRTRSFQCVGGNRWNDTLSACLGKALDKKTLRETKNVTGPEFSEDIELDTIKKVPIPETDMVFDILVPSVIMGVLVLGNTIIVIVLLKLRRSVKDESDTESVDTIPPVTELGYDPSYEDQFQMKPIPKPTDNGSSVFHTYKPNPTTSQQLRPPQRLVTDV